MTTLLEELTKLDEKKNYTIIINGIGSFRYVTTCDLKLDNIKEEQKSLLDFSLVNKKDFGKYCVLEFFGKTKLEQKEIVQFLLDLIGYNKKMFKPVFVTIIIKKHKGEKPTLIVIEIKQQISGKISSENLKTNYNSETIAILGDYYFRTYDSYQSTLQNLGDIWVN